MALKFKLKDQAAVDALPEAVRTEYSQQEDGSFVLAVEVAQGDAGLEDVSGLKAALRAERENVGAAKQKLSELRTALGNLTPEQIAAAAAKVAAGEDAAVVQLRAQNDSLRGELQAASRANAQRAAIDAERGNPALLGPYCDTHVKYEADGKVKLGTTVYPTIGEAVKALRTDPALASAFAGSGNSGGGSGSTSGGGSTLTLPTRRSKMSIAEKAAYIAANGTDSFMQIPN